MFALTLTSKISLFRNSEVCPNANISNKNYFPSVAQEEEFTC
jgi:hypothetical protein